MRQEVECEVCGKRGSTMKLVLTNAAEIGLRTLGQDDRQRVFAWFSSLRNWKNDKFVREHSHKLGSLENTYVFQTATDIRVFFKIEIETITVVDIATKSTILMSGRIPGANSE
jgi:hypothetical protein